jgi:1-acyl-sn-glycerol-3-phosphate acyltransferase
MLLWVSHLWYDATYWLTGTGLLFGSSLRTEGARNVPASGPALLIANHTSYFDPVLIGVAARRRLSYLARKTLFQQTLFGKLLSSLNAIPVDQEGTGIEGLRQMLQLLREGHAVMMFPEGERTGTGHILDLKPGVSLLVKRANAPIVPVGIAGAYAAWPRTRTLPRLAPIFLGDNPAKIAVSIGRAIASEKFAAMPREQMLRELRILLECAQKRAERLREAK